MLLVPLLALVPLVASDPVDTENPGYTRTVTWDFDEPADYSVSGTVVSGGMASLQLLNESVTEDSQDDYAGGSSVNIDAASYPGSLVIDDTDTFTATVKLQPDAAAGQDTYIYEDKMTDNYGLEDELKIDSETSKVYRILIRFDVSSIPAGAYVNDASLWMYQNPGGKGNDIMLNIHSLDVPFVETEVDWNRPSVSEFWDTPGGDYSSEAFCRSVLDNTAGWKSFDISGLAECWIRGTMSNNGMILVPDEAVSDAVKDFISSDESAWAIYRPYLSINYTIQGNEGAYESGVLGPGTNSTFTLLDWSNSTMSLLTDEFLSSSLSSKWAWENDPVQDGGSYNVGLTVPGWLHVVGSPNAVNVDDHIGSNYLYQEVTGGFTATTSLTELFTVDHMDAGILLVENEASWISIAKADRDASGVVEVTVCRGGTSSLVATVPWADATTAHLKVVRDSSGFWFNTSADGVAWTEVYHHAPDAPMAQKVRIGLFLASASAAQPTVQFDYLRVEPSADPTFEIMARTGNSTSPSDPSWTDWSSPFPGDEASLGVTCKYIRYRVYMSTALEWVTPAFSGLTAHWERYSSAGSVETDDYSPADFSSWLSFSAVHDGTIEYHLSADGGESWDLLGSGTTMAFYSQDRTVRLRAVMIPHDTLVTCSIDSFSLTYATALATFYVTAPSEVAVGEPFTMDIWAKNSENKTITSWFGDVTLTAMDATGTVEASSDLLVTSVGVSSAGHVTVSGQRYYVAEVIAIMVEGDGIAGVSAPIAMLAGPIVDLRILPEDFDSILEGTTAVLQAAAVDAYGNTFPGVEYSWTISESLGELNSTTGPSVTLIPGVGYSSGFVNVTCDGFSASRLVTIECLGHPPEFVSSIPDQYVVEDGPTWVYDLSPHVIDPNDDDDDLRWYVTGEDLVVASDENKTGNMMLTLTPRPDMYGEDMLRLFVVDPDGAMAETTFVVYVEPVNDAPTIAAIPPLVVRYDNHYVFNLRYYISDVDNDHDELTISTDAASEPYVDVDNSRLSLVLTYPLDLIDTTQVVGLTVSDGSLSSSSAIVVSVSDDEVPVQILSLPSVVLHQGEALLAVFDLDDHFMDPDGDDLHYTVSESNVYIDITSENEVNVYAPVVWSGEEHVVFSAIDPQGARAEAAVQVTVLPVNQAPWIADVPDLKVRFDTRYDLDIARFIGDDDDPVDTLAVSTDDSHIAVIGTTLSMLYPASMDGMNVSVTITVCDGELADSWTINITISDNTPPESLGPPDHAFTEDWPIPYPSAGSVEDWFEDAEDGDDLSFLAFPWGEEVTVTAVEHPVAGTSLRFYSAPNYHGEMQVTIRATDTEGAFVEDTITLTVVSSPDAPVFDITRDFTAAVGVEVSYDLAIYVTDPDSEPSQLTFEVSSDYADYITVASTLVRMHFPESFLGSGESSRVVDIDIRVVDQDGMCDSSTMHITVSRPGGAEGLGPFEMGVLILAAGISVGLFAMVLMMRKKPFVIRDMMIVHEDGFLISRHEAAAEPDESMDEDIFTGMLTAVLNFVEDSMSTSQDRLKFFGFEDYRVMIQRGGKIYAAIVFEGDRPKEIEAKLAEFLAKVEKVYRKSLEHWTGDMDVDFAGAHLLIEAFVKENGKKGRGKNGNGRMTKRESPAPTEAQSEEPPAPADLQDAVDETAAAEGERPKRKLRKRKSKKTET